MAVDNFFFRAALKAPMRIFPRDSPTYQNCQNKITLERVDDDALGYAGYSGRTNDYISYHPYFFRDSSNDQSYPPFGYVNSFKTPALPGQHESLLTPKDTNWKVTGKDALETRITTTEAGKSNAFKLNCFCRPYRSRSRI